MGKSFLFIIALTPSRLLTPLRKLLYDEFAKSLQQQTYSNWEALLIGESNRDEGKLKFRSIGAESKEIKLIFASEYIRKLSQKPDFIIRMDDDDIINPGALANIASEEFDCFADKYHAFYDIVSGKISLQKRNFLANTVVHKFEHAVKEIGRDNIPLLQCDHSVWIDYYRAKKIRYASKNDPLYLRVLSPTTVTNGVFGQKGSVAERYNKFKTNITNLQRVEQFDLQHYDGYLRSHGHFLHRNMPAYENALIDLSKQWYSFSGLVHKKSRTEVFKDKLTQIFLSR